MVVSAKMTIQHVPSKRRMSLYKLQNFTFSRRQSIGRIVYGVLFAVLAVVMAIINPVQIITDYVLDMKEGSFLFHMWEKPTYDVITEVRVFNYTNVQEYLDGRADILQLEEIGPFRYQEFRTNENITVDKERGVMTMRPKATLKFIREGSIGDPNDIVVMMPNLALLAISTLAADQLNYLTNIGAYYSIKALGSSLFTNLTAEEFFWGYYDPLVTLANKILPGWIDFGKIGLMDRFYALEAGRIEVELRNASRRYSINKWGGSEGLAEQGFTDMKTSTLCNRIKGAYEGLMISPGVTKETRLPIFKHQACRIYPFNFQKEISGPYGFKQYRFAMDDLAFNKTSEYACHCDKNCLPDGFVDISGCYYGFPIALSKPHFLDADPVQRAYFQGMKPDHSKHTSRIDLEPNIGAPVSFDTMIQVNVAVRMSYANPITKPLNNKVMPLLWIKMSCQQPPPSVVTILRLRLVIAPPLVITIEVVLFIIGFILGVQGCYRIWKPKYNLIPNKSEPEVRLRKVSYPLSPSDNKGFHDDDDLAKEAVSLLAIKEEDCEVPDLLIET